MWIDLEHKNGIESTLTVLIGNRKVMKNHFLTRDIYFILIPGRLGDKCENLLQSRDETTDKQ